MVFKARGRLLARALAVFFIENGVRYHHLLNPRTGKSATGVRSVSIIGPDATMTDGLSKVFVLGPARAIKVIESVPGYDTIVVDDRHRVHFSKGLAPPAGDGAAPSARRQ